MSDARPTAPPAGGWPPGLQLVLITGMSGSGKSVALKALEDGGYYCVDNLPADLVGGLAEFLKHTDMHGVAVSVDVRSHQTLRALPDWIKRLREGLLDLRVLYLDAKDETLVKRFSETRRRHPLSGDTSTLPESIARERELLSEVSALAHHVDTSDLSTHALRQWIRDFVGTHAQGLTVLFQSFGFKHGIPLDADIVFDVRCLANPHYEPLLRPLTGKDAPVVEFLRGTAEAQRMLSDIGTFVHNWLPCFSRDLRSYLTVAIGCTGGRHRSVYIAEQLAARFAVAVPVLVRHRELST